MSPKSTFASIDAQADGLHVTLTEEFPGGFVVIEGAESPSDVRSVPAKYVVIEEVDDLDGGLAQP